MNDISNLFFELIRVAIGTQDMLTRPPSGEEWKLLYDMAKKQSLVGICFSAVQKLTNTQEPITQNLDEVQYLTWMGMAAKIQQRNEVVNRQCVELCSNLKKEGFRTCILKGQGTAALYRVHDDDNDTLRYDDLSMLRQSGDIDVWVMPKDERTIKGSQPRIKEFVHEKFPNEKGAFIHIGFPCFSVTEVEMHYIPTMDGNPWVDRRFRQLFEERQDECFGTTGLGFALPEPMVNVLFNLHHVKRHFITSGIGLRHVLDLYFVLRSFNENSDSNLFVWIKRLGMEKFFAGIVWVMQEVLFNENANSNRNFGIRPDERLGRFILQEIMQGGNFGYHDERLKDIRQMGFWKRWRKFLYVSATRARYFPFEILWSYVFRLRIGIWHRTGIVL